MHNSLKDVQKFQAAFMLAMREMAMHDPISAAYYFSISKDEALRMTDISPIEFHDFFLSCPPILAIKCSEIGLMKKGNHPLSALMDMIQEDVPPTELDVTIAHINSIPDFKV